MPVDLEYEPEEGQGMLSAPPAQKAKRWPWLAVATVVLCISGVGLSQAGALSSQREHSVMHRVSMVHKQIGAIVAAAVEGDKVDVGFGLHVDSFEHKGTPPSGMSFIAEMKQGGKHKWPRVSAKFTAKPGKGAALKDKLDKILGAAIQSAPKDQQAEIKESIKVTADGLTVTVLVSPPKDDKTVVHEDHELKDAFQQIKPSFSAEVAIGHSFSDMDGLLDDSKTSVLKALRGIKVKLNAKLSNTVFDMIAHSMPPESGATEAVGVFKALRYVGAPIEIFYTDVNKLDKLLPPIPIKDAIEGECASFPPDVQKTFKGLGDVLDGMDEVVMEGLPYNWEVVVNFKKWNPAPILERCV